MPKKTKSFEENLSELQKIVDVLDTGKVPLAEVLQLYKDGISLIEKANQELERAEQEMNVVIVDNGLTYDEKEFDDEENL